jgi:hypothetical protein
MGSENSIDIFYTKKTMDNDNIARTLICTSLDCQSPGVVEDYEIHGSHKDVLMTFAMLSKKITPLKPNFLKTFELTG